MTAGVADAEGASQPAAGRGPSASSIELVFLGTRAHIDARNRRHRRHSALLVRYGSARLLIDCGADWLGRIDAIAPTAIALTHAHPDHAWGLEAGAPCPVHATRETWHLLADYPITDRLFLDPRVPAPIDRLTVEAFPVVHSILAPAVGFRISAGARHLFYVPDVVAIEARGDALAGVGLYVGDGSSITRSLVRRHDAVLFGHTTIRAQLGWCGEEAVPTAIFTHCGTEIVTGDERRLGPMVRRLGRERGVAARLAHDGLRVLLDESGVRERHDGDA